MKITEQNANNALLKKYFERYVREQLCADERSFLEHFQWHVHPHYPTDKCGHPSSM